MRDERYVFDVEAVETVHYNDERYQTFPMMKYQQPYKMKGVFEIYV